MRVGVTLYAQNFNDWERYLAREAGDTSQPLSAKSDAAIWRSEIALGLLVEELGYDSLWTIEHHIGPYTMVTNPVQLLTYYAGATSRIDVGTMVVVLPWHHPVRVAEDITMLQYALGGRTPFIGFGRGAARREFAKMGFDMNESRERFDEGIQIVKLALTEEHFSWDGKHWQLPEVTMRPRPDDPAQLIDNFHFAWGSDASAAIGAGFGLKPMIIPQKALADYHKDLEVFSQVRAGIGLEPARPRIHLNAFCAETEVEAEEGARRYIPEYVDSAIYNYEVGGNHFQNLRGYEQYASTAAAATQEQIRAGMQQTYLENHVWGTPEQCVAKLQKIADAFHPEEFMLVFRYGSMPAEVAEKSLRLFAKEVLPALHDMPVGAPIVYAGSDA